MHAFFEATLQAQLLRLSIRHVPFVFFVILAVYFCQRYVYLLYH